MVEILVPLGFFALVFGIFWVVADYKTKSTLIKHGADAKTLKMDKSTNGSLRFGLLLVGVGFGVLLGNLIAETTSMQEEVAYLSMTFLLGGISLLVYHFITGKKMKSNTDEM